MEAPPRPYTGLQWPVTSVVRKYTSGPGILRPGERTVVFDRYTEAYLVFAILEADSPDIEVMIDLYGDGSFDIRLSPRKLMELGLTAPSPSSAWVSRYDDSSRTYVALYTPSPWIPFRGYTRAYVSNRGRSPSRYYFEFWLVERG